MKKSIYIVLIFLSVVSFSCASVKHVKKTKISKVHKEKVIKNEESVENNESDNEKAVKGYATWYGGSFHGKRTANDEVYDMYAYTAAHRNLPFGTKVKVTNPTNNKSVTVRINDRGPFQKRYMIDLSYKAFNEIRNKNSGEVKVIVEKLTGENIEMGTITDAAIAIEENEITSKPSITVELEKS